MFESKEEVAKLAESMNIKVVGLESVPTVKMSPIFFENGEDLFQAEGMNLTFANFPDNHIEALAKVSDQYSLIQHWDAVGQVLESFRDLPEFSLNKVEISVSDNGGRCWAKFGSTNPITIKPGDDIFPQVTLTNSCDTSKRFWLSWGAVRQICTNGMMGPDNRIEGGTAKRLHRIGTLSIEDEIRIFKESFGQASESLDIWKEYPNIDINAQDVLDVFDFMEISEKQGEEIIALPIRGDNTTLQAQLLRGEVSGWTAYNAITQWITDTIDNPATQMDRGAKATIAFDKVINGRSVSRIQD